MLNTPLAISCRRHVCLMNLSLRNKSIESFFYTCERVNAAVFEAFQINVEELSEVLAHQTLIMNKID